MCVNSKSTTDQKSIQQARNATYNKSSILKNLQKNHGIRACCTTCRQQFRHKSQVVELSINARRQHFWLSVVNKSGFYPPNLVKIGLKLSSIRAPR